jgi:hypothetical protein
MQTIENSYTRGGEGLGFEPWSWCPTLAISAFMPIKLGFIDNFTLSLIIIFRDKSSIKVIKLYIYMINIQTSYIIYSINLERWFVFYKKVRRNYYFFSLVNYIRSINLGITHFLRSLKDTKATDFEKCIFDTNSKTCLLSFQVIYYFL